MSVFRQTTNAGDIYRENSGQPMARIVSAAECADFGDMSAVEVVQQQVMLVVPVQATPTRTRQTAKVRLTK